MALSNVQLQELLAQAYSELVAQRTENDLLRVELEETKETLSDLRYEVYGPDASYVSYFEWKDSCKYVEKQLKAKELECEQLKEELANTVEEVDRATGFLDDLEDEYESLRQAYDSLLAEQEMMDDIVRQGKEYDRQEIERLTQLLKSEEFKNEGLIEQYGECLCLY